MKKPPEEIATELLRRLLGGERGQLSLHLAMLLERASPFDSGDNYYRWILPPEISDLRISKEAADEIIGALCREISQNPDAVLIGTMSFTGAKLATKTVATVLINPPRPLTMNEYDTALSLLVKFLPEQLADDRKLLPRSELRRLLELIRLLEKVQDDGPDRAARIGVREHASNLSERLTQLGFRV